MFFFSFSIKDFRQCIHVMPNSYFCFQENISNYKYFFFHIYSPFKLSEVYVLVSFFLTIVIISFLLLIV